MHSILGSTFWGPSSRCVDIVHSSIFQTEQKQNSQFHLNDKDAFCIICYFLALRGFSMPTFLHLCPAECNSQPSSQWTRKPAILPDCLPASSPLSDQQTVEEWACFRKLMVHALLPGLKMDWNVVYLKHSRPPLRKTDQNTETLVWDSGNFLEGWGTLR